MQYLTACIACELVIPCGFIFNEIMKSHLHHSLWLICETNATEKNTTMPLQFSYTKYILTIKKSCYLPPRNKILKQCSDAANSSLTLVSESQNYRSVPVTTQWQIWCTRFPAFQFNSNTGVGVTASYLCLSKKMSRHSYIPPKIWPDIFHHKYDVFSSYIW